MLYISYNRIYMIYCQFIISANKKENVAYLILHVESHSWILCFLTWMKLAIAYN